MDTDKVAGEDASLTGVKRRAGDAELDDGSGRRKVGRTEETSSASSSAGATGAGAGALAGAEPASLPVAEVTHPLPLLSAVETGNVAEVKRLLTDKAVDPAANNNAAVRRACALGHTEIVKALLADERVDPGAENQDCIVTSAGKGHLEIVKMLLKHPKVDPSA